MARKTKLSIFDEPEAGIDLWSFHNLIRGVPKHAPGASTASIIIISHQERILDIADEIMRAGRRPHLRSRARKEEILPKLLHEDSRFSLSAIRETKSSRERVDA